MIREAYSILLYHELNFLPCYEKEVLRWRVRLMPAANRWIAGDDGDGGCHHDGKEYFCVWTNR